MLKEISIKDFALIDDLKINLKKGFNVFTGETGSGKSIIIDALSFALGKRSDKSYVRTGKDKSIIEAIFFISQNTRLKISPLLEAEGIDLNEDVIFLRRELFSDGRSTCRINGTLVTINFLKKLSTFLIAIHGQNEFDTLLEKEKQIEIVDEYGGIRKNQEYKDYTELYIEYKEIQNSIKKLSKESSEFEIAREIDLLQYQINEIQDAKLSKTEIEEIQGKLDFWENSEEISLAVNKSYNLLYSDKENILKSLNDILRDFEKYKNMDSSIASWTTILEDIYYKLEDLAFSVRDELGKFEYDSEILNQTKARFDTINKILTKYGKTYEEVMEFLEKSLLRTEYLENISINSEKLKYKLGEIENEMNFLSKNLYMMRIKAAKEFEKEIILELESLGMINTRFKVEILESDTFNEIGKDSLEFLITFNKGENLKPFKKVASGGEISRFMLALKKIISGVGDVDSMIFDEIDTGISGVASQMVGNKMNEISKTSQVICITHLPQIASKGTSHYLVEKIEVGDMTKTVVETLDKEERVKEIAKMLGGQNITNYSLKYAKELISNNN
ncbi:DNA repair protein RecN (Recombination protein N) [Acetoanaerobium pronyense]|uniref:DNA repair protein RecN n=1 Tax=Acetoanaerobium pronyense TaxID=1482736 RepID=A0ABS4KII2_9FIRM|nr:DNA repair protein RecN [Acetoanaerobium pronyense]MBP2027595.1 DNA repair protein RecN (Recombination protein N) [Acetoanaerobium pronyense]